MGLSVQRSFNLEVFLLGIKITYTLLVGNHCYSRVSHDLISCSRNRPAVFHFLGNPRNRPWPVNNKGVSCPRQRHCSLDSPTKVLYERLEVILGTISLNKGLLQVIFKDGTPLS